VGTTCNHATRHARFQQLGEKLRKTRFLAIGALGVAAALTLSACAAGGAGSTAPTIGASGKGKTITVWAMTGDLTPATLNAINAEFTKETGAKVNVQTQQWANITTKVTTALATSTPPDVIDLGNTQVPGYAANGGLADLTKYKSQLEQGQTWLGGLVDPATVNGKLYAVPSFAGTRAVIYNKKVWAAAGITSTPTTYSELTADLDKVKTANSSPDFSAFYLPGQYWYNGVQWVWDAGGNIATQNGKTWSAGFSSAAAQKGLNDFKTFQNTYSSVASRTLQTTTPDQDALFASGKAGAIEGNGWEIGVIEKDNPALTDSDLGTFPFPGVSGKNQPVMLGGSDWGIATKSKNQSLALVWTKIAASPSIQNTYVFGKEGWIPNSTQGIAKAQSSIPAVQSGFFAAAKNSKSTPAAANWSTIEGDNSIDQFFQAVATGSSSVSDAAKSFDAHVDSTLNGN
jgi:N,N'-diacetylchitobiose transport system substrate-binding protein